MYIQIDPLATPDSKVHGANMRPIWGRQDPGGPHVGPMNFAVWGTWPMTVYLSYTPFDKSNGRFLSDAKINMMPSSNLHDFWWVYWMHVRVHFPCQIYWLFVLTPYPRGSKDGECSFFLNQVWIIVNFMRWHLADSDEIVHTSNLRRFLNFTQMSWRLAALLQNHERMNACHCVSSSVSLCMLI